MIKFDSKYIRPLSVDNILCFLVLLSCNTFRENIFNVCLCNHEMAIFGWLREKWIVLMQIQCCFNKQKH